MSQLSFRDRAKLTEVLSPTNPSSPKAPPPYHGPVGPPETTPLQKALLQAVNLGEDIQGFMLFPVFERPDPQNPNNRQRYHEVLSFKTLKDLKRTCSMYGPTSPLFPCSS